jgi:hypothetical protein
VHVATFKCLNCLAVSKGGTASGAYADDHGRQRIFAAASLRLPESRRK